MRHHNSIQCEDVLKNLNDYIDGELDEELCNQIEAHIDSCTNCKVILNTLRKTIELYRKDGERTQLPLAVRQRLFTCLDIDKFMNSNG